MADEDITVTNCFQQLSCYLESGYEISKSEFEKRIERIARIPDNIKQFVRDIQYAFVVKDNDGFVTIL
jgi:hypothetical protein